MPHHLLQLISTKHCYLKRPLVRMDCKLYARKINKDGAAENKLNKMRTQFNLNQYILQRVLQLLTIKSCHIKGLLRQMDEKYTRTERVRERKRSHRDGAMSLEGNQQGVPLRYVLSRTWVCVCVCVRGDKYRWGSRKKLHKVRTLLFKTASTSNGFLSLRTQDM